MAFTFWNGFAYCENEPVDNSDPTGEHPFLAIGLQVLITVMSCVVGFEFLWDTKKVGNVSNPWNIYRNGTFINNTMQNRVTMRDIYTFLKNNKYI